MIVVALVPLAGTTAAELPAGWADPVKVGDDLSATSSADEGSVAVAPDGRALAVIEAYDSIYGSYVIQARFFEPGQGWGPFSTVAPYAGSYDQLDPSVASFPNGSFIVVFEVDLGTSSRVYADIWQPDRGWESPALLTPSPYPLDIQGSVVATDEHGDAFVVWRNADLAEINITAKRYSGTDGWDADAYTLDSATGAGYAPRVAADKDGNAICVWSQTGTSVQRAWANRYTVGSGWGTAQIVDSGDFDVDAVDVAFESSGVGMVLMDQSNGTEERAIANTFTPGSGWGTATPIDDGTSHGIGTVGIVSNGAGSFVAAWTQANTTEYHVMAATYDAAQGWGAPTNLTTGDWKSPYDVYVAATPDGSAFLVWYQYTPDWGTIHTRMASMAPDGSWSAPYQVDRSSYSFSRDVACGTGGHCVALFVQTDGAQTEMYGTSYATPDTVPPALDVTHPADATSTDTPTVVVSGTAEPGSTVVVNGIQAHVSGSGEFSLSVALMPGDNAIEVTATDDSGNAATSSVTVTFNDPVPGLEADLADANDEIDHLHDGLHDAQDSLDATNTDLTATQADLAQAQADLTAAQAELTAAQAVDTTHTENIDAAAGSAGTAMIVGLLGLVVGLVALALAFMMGRKGGGSSGGGGGASTAPPEPAAAPPATEPPKSG